MPKKPKHEEEEHVMGRDPLADDDEILATTFFGSPGTEPPPRPSAPRRPRTPRRKKAKPTHYKVISISMYTDDIERLDAMVAELKANGHPKANRSALIRYALATVDLDKMPPSY